MNERRTGREAACAAIGVGLAFGAWPVRPATSLDPIEALRHE
jgi:ABC-type antimicrobial peptide transport system permease subunit